MADPTSLDDLMAKQKVMTDLAAQMVGEEDVERIQAIAAELQVHAAELQAMGESLAREAGKTSAQNWTQVQLTVEQRQRVKAKTGQDLELLRIPDPAGVASRTMPHTDPRIIEYYALREAERQKVAAEADAELKVTLRESLAEIEASGTPAVLEKLEELKQDPSFAGGLLKKLDE